MNRLNIFDRIYFLFNKRAMRLSNIVSHVANSKPQNIIYRNGDKYQFFGFSSSDQFEFDPLTIKQISGDFFTARSTGQVISDIVDLLYKYGFKKVKIISNPTN